MTYVNNNYARTKSLPTYTVCVCLCVCVYVWYSLAFSLCAHGTICTVEELSFKQLNCDDGKDEHEELVDNEDIEDVFQGRHHTIKHGLHAQKKPLKLTQKQLLCLCICVSQSFV